MIATEADQLPYEANGIEAVEVRPIGFEYDGSTITNRFISGYMTSSDAPDERAARQRLAKAKINVESISPRYASRRRQTKITRAVTGDFAGQLAERLDAGQTLPTACRAIARQTTNERLSDALEQVSTSLIDDGLNPAPAFRLRRDVFPDLLISAIQVGHEKGDYPGFLRHYEETEQQHQETINIFRSALVYPAIIITIGLAIAAGLVYFVLPQIEKVLTVMMQVRGNELPLPTRIVLGGGRFLMSPAGLLMIGAIILICFLARRWARSATGRETLQRHTLYWPVVGSLLRDHHAAYVSRTIGLLIDTDVLSALRETTKATTNIEYREMLEDVYETVLAEGLYLSDALAPYGHLMGDEFSPSLVTGEQAGKMDSQLVRYAEMLDARVRRRVKNLSKYIEPALTVIIGGAVVLIIAAVYLPITDVTSRLSGN